VLYLDTDEYLSKQAIEDLPKLIAANFDCVWFNRRNFVDGVDVEPILKEDQQLRLFRKGAVRYQNSGHTYPEVANNTTVLHSSLEIIHERTLSGVIKANKAREASLPQEQVAQQNKFIEAVTKLVKENEGFTEDWYSTQQLISLREACNKVATLAGCVVELGSWEGKSTCAIANVLKEDTVIAVDSWQGNLGEGNSHPSVVAAKQRDVLSKFRENVKRFTDGNVEAVVSDCFAFLTAHKDPIKFCHIDASHDYASVKKAISMVQPFLVKGAVICGDDFMSANAKRSDLGGGVERAVVEMCPGFVSQENFWYWINK
jgi:predicted O-methyltransferase YrrM